MKVAVLLCLVVAASAAGLGDRLVRSALIYKDLPLTSRAAVAAGWVLSSSCDPKLGFQATQDGSALPQRHTPVSLYYSASGQLSGYSTEIYGPVASTALRNGWYRQTGRGVYRISMGFRTGGVCDAKTRYVTPVGDVLFVANTNRGADFSIPLTAASAVKRGFTKGSCISGMGTHYAIDEASGSGALTWKANSLFPLMPMYDLDGSITAMLIPSLTRQFQFLYQPNQHDGVVIPNFAMCLNFCDKRCSWKDHDWSVWSTMHVWFRDHKKIECPSRCP